ncbi:MAG: PIN domain-containing protein [Syntrophaceae bacterium]|nr:PIN domain-containing protein [Syntrophaceae bacterium]
MRILVDTSIWSLALRRSSEVINPEAVLLKTIIEQGEDIYLLGIILQEVLQEIRSSKDFLALKEYFKAFPLIDLTREDYIRAAELKNHLIRKGKQGSTIDVLIASAAISHHCHLFTADKHFTHIAELSELKLLSLRKT